MRPSLDFAVASRIMLFIGEYDKQVVGEYCEALTALPYPSLRGCQPPDTIETRGQRTSNDIVEGIDLRVGYTAAGAQRGQRRKPLYDGIRQFVASNVL